MSTLAEFLDIAKALSGEALRAAIKALPDDVQKAYFAHKKAAMFAPEKERLDSRKDHLSPSGRYKLVVSRFETGKGSWDYSQGVVYRKDDDKPIAIIQRNYGAFPFLFVEDHPNGHDYLIGGEDYQGQTVVELDTGRKVNNLSAGASMGGGFCWASYTFNREHLMLVVDGCHWACPYEYRFFDFSDPMNGWPEITTEQYVDADRKEPVFNADGTITCFQSEDVEDDDDDDDRDEDEKPTPIAATLTFRRDGLTLKLVNEWVSEKEQKSRADREEANRKYQEWLTNFRATDPLYLAMLQGLKDGAFSPDDYDAIGVTYNDWCPEFKFQEKRMCRRIAKKGVSAHTLDLEWGAETGPVKLIVFKDGKHVEDRFFMEHSVASMQAAFAYAKALLTGERCDVSECNQAKHHPGRHGNVTPKTVGD